MYVLCEWCRAEGKPCMLREIEPLGTPTATHGICDAHASSVLAKGRAAMELAVESEQEGGRG